MSVSPIFQTSRDLLEPVEAVRSDAVPTAGMPTAGMPTAGMPTDGVPKDSGRRVYFEVFGCQMNKLDAELMLGTLLDHGYTVTDRIDEAGVALYVTCSVREHAENRVFSKIGRLRDRKRRDPGFVLGLLGCMAQNHPRVRSRHPHIDILCGTAEFLRIPELIEAARSKGPVTALDLEVDLNYTRRRNLGPRSTQAYVSVMRGCDMVCSFCIVPRTRGPEVSKPVREIVDEVRALVDDGVREVTLLGQTVNSYGKRLAPGRAIGLQRLLHELNKLSGLDRIRFITSHPSFMNDDLIEAMGNLEKVCEYLHLPIQSGSDAVLKAMRRGYTVDHYRRVIENCRARIPGFRLATDFIVGFPGETDADFEATCRILEEMEYQNSFIFKYSPRPGTAADDLPDDVPHEVKQERNQRLLALQHEVSARIYDDSVGRVVDVLVEGPSRNDASRWTGRNRANQIVVFPVSGDDARAGLGGRILPVRIDTATALTLAGELLTTSETPAGDAPRTGSVLPPLPPRGGARGDPRPDSVPGSSFVPLDGVRILDER